MPHSETLLPDTGYEVIRHLGKGTMGTVYLVKRKSDGKELVIKKLIITSTSGLNETSAREIFQRESQLLKRFSHHGLPEIYDTFIEDGQDYLVMEYIKGETLEDIINKNQGFFPVDKAIKVAMEIAEILDYLHNSFEAPVVYKDLKPSNIIITPEGKPRLVDFGTSRYYSPDKDSDTHRLGTPGYAAPEQYNKKGQTTPQSDLFALGVILFQLLTKYDPTVTPLKFPSMKSLTPSIPDKLEEIIKKSIQLEPVNRYISIIEFKEELEKYMGIKKSSPSSYKPIKTDGTNLYDMSSRNYTTLVMFVRQLALMITYGFTIMSGLDLLYEERRYAKLRKTLTEVRKEVEKGSALYKALGMVPAVFSPLFINMIKAGETGEKLKPALDKLADLLETDLKLEKKFHRATIAPLAILSMATIMILFMVTFILPTFVDLFEGMDLALPLPTKIIIGITKNIRNPFIIKIFILFLIAVIAAFKRRNGKILYDKIKLYIPLLGPLYKKMAISRFCRASGALISSNIPVGESLDLAAKSTGNRFITKKIEENSKYGNIALSLAMTGFFPMMIYELIETEEENAKLAETFYKISDDYNSEIESTLEKMLPVIESILIIGAGLITVFLIISLFMPRYQHT